MLFANGICQFKWFYFFLLVLYFLRSRTIVSQRHFVKILKVFLYSGIFQVFKRGEVGSKHEIFLIKIHSSYTASVQRVY